jgi:protein-tyrosine phosphatase
MAVLAVQMSPWGLPLLWVAVAYVLAGLAYFTGNSRFLGKRQDGTVAPGIAVLTFPYLLLCIAASLARHLYREPDWNEVAPGLFVGRRVSGARLPAQIDLVVDLTSEFPEPSSVRTGRAYRCLPTMDGCASEPGAFAALAREVADTPGRIYVHCAVGHGRSASLAAAVIILRGLATDVDSAEALMKKARPGIDLKGPQREIVTRATSLPSSFRLGG